MDNLLNEKYKAEPQYHAKESTQSVGIAGDGQGCPITQPCREV